MIKNYLKIAWRNLLRSKTFSAINILGLAVGLACFLLISLYVLDELSFDKSFPNADRIYRISSKIRFNGLDLQFALTSDMMGQLVKKDYPEIEEYARFYNSNGSKLIRKGSQYINEFMVCHVDSTFFRIFSLPVIAGDIKNALNEPNTVVITEKAALKYFGTTQALGKLIETNDNNKSLYKVTGVIRDLPPNIHFGADFYFSMKNAGYSWGQIMSHNFHTYLLLKPGTDYKKLEGKFTEYIEKYCLPQLKQILHTNSIADFQKQGDKIEYDLTPLTKIHLYSNLQYEIRPGGDIQYVYIFSAVAIFILVIACINFMNLTTARSANRAKEVGIRKVLGTVKKDLIAQFLVECTLMVFISLLLAIGIAALILPVFNEVASKSMRFSSLFSSMLLPLLIVLPFAVGLLAGSYPAFFLSSFQPIAVLKGRINRGSGSLRSLLVVFQFTTSIILIIGTIVIYRQLHYIQTKNLGFNKNEVLIINGTDALGSNVDAFKTEMLKMTGVKSGTISGFLPVNSSNRSDDVFSLSSVMDTKNSFDMQVWGIDEDYLPTMEMQLIKGRNFSKSFGTDSGAVVINETAAGYFQGADPLGQKLYSGYFANNNSIRPYTVIGVVKNFNFESLKQNVGPLGFFLRRNPGLVSFKVNAANSPDIVKLAENKWKDLAPGMPFSYRFMDNAFNDMYKVEQRIGKIILIFSTIAIAIACLGLFGLSTFIAEQRTKEIGIRKALGSSVSGIVQLLSRDFMRLVAISFIIAAPFAWWFMNKWLQDFANRTSLSWWIFLLSGTIALAIALFTVSFQAIRAAMMNPVRSLRTE